VAKLYLDEQVGDFLRTLGDDGHDVVVTGFPPRKARSDAWHFREALSGARTIITLNRSDFLYLHQLWTSLRTFGLVPAHHYGILTTIQSGYWTRDEWLQAIRVKLREPEALRGRMSAWLRSSDQDRWLSEQWRADEE
jgi:hypothetical protein